MQNRISALDWTKGISIILMVYGHITHTGSLKPTQDSLVALIYTFHMPLFLLISGYLFKPDQNILRGLGKLSKRVIRPYLFFASLYLICLFLISKTGIKTNNPPPTSAAEFIEIIFIHPRGGYWFLHSLILINTTLLLSYALAKRFSTSSAAIVISILALAVMSSFGMLKERTIIYFCLGFLLFSFVQELPRSLIFGIIALITLTATSYSSIFHFGLYEIAWTMAIVSFTSGTWNIMQNTLLAHIIEWTGRNSLIILVLHAFFVVAMKPAANVFLYIDHTGVFYSIAVLAITVCGSLFAAICFDRIGLSQFLFGGDSIYSPLTSPGIPGRSSASTGPA